MASADTSANASVNIRAAISEATARAWVGGWLVAVAVLVFAMILVGGATRLTDSGLSITEWALVHGVLPPLNEAEWQAEFARYRLTPEYQLQNKGMSLAGFQFIFWWEWGHRLLGRVIGFAFALPLLAFAVLRMLPKGFGWRLVAMLALGGLQGAIGWWMVSSGLTGDRLDVAAYRLAVHLSMAIGLLALLVWTALDVLAPRTGRSGDVAVAPWAMGFVLLLAVQIVLGAFVAGTDAGFVYNDWPTMGGAWWPQGWGSLEPVWRNFVENKQAIQFNHRIGAYALLALAVVFWAKARGSAAPAVRLAGLAVLLGTLGQAALGITTLLAYGIVTPPHVSGVLIGVAHQGLGAVLFVIAALALRSALPGPARPRPVLVTSQG